MSHLVVVANKRKLLRQGSLFCSYFRKISSSKIIINVIVTIKETNLEKKYLIETVVIVIQVICHNNYRMQTIRIFSLKYALNLVLKLTKKVVTNSL